MKKLYAIALVLAILGLAGCGHRNGEEGDRHAADLEGIEVIQIDHGSTTLHLESADIDSLEASLLRYDNGPGITLNKGKRRLSIGLQSSFFRIFNPGMMPQLKVRIPNGFAGQIILQGTSGSVHASSLDTEDLRITGKSGSITLDFADFHSNVSVSTASGNVKLVVNSPEPDLRLKLRSGSGSHSVALPLQEHRQSKGMTEGSAGSGTHEISIKTGSGHISVQ
ncbi:DUF4097 family beta strand repeat-containing protein [Paenibacillus dendritiformis]|uniref:DUF4097 family beta strand repeat-containing protein n=1 Tax=Paenibacillus dendritiformis TaxID=130049 RepID=UPI00248AEEBA|nr:DUF4097 family beta strand repeat-containing protein [Paenibacillus dendritiformis]WGU95676.1 DUF4097 family beta strand repeat-containing protein [Paenibacillus dendritiformis]